MDQFSSNQIQSQIQNIPSTSDEVYNANNNNNEIFIGNHHYNSVQNNNPYNNNYINNSTTINTNNSLNNQNDIYNNNNINTDIIEFPSNIEVTNPDIEDNIYNICILKNKKFCYLDGSCQILKIKDLNKYKLKIEDKNSNSKINYIMELNDERLLICNLDYLIKIIEIDYITKKYEFTNILREHLNLITKVIELKNGKLCSCSFDGCIKLWKKNNINFEFEMDLNFFEKGKFYSLLEVNEIIFSLLNYDNKKILYFMNLNKKIDGKKIIENINLKRENLIQLNNNYLIIGGNNVIYIYDINNNEETPIKCNYIICSLYLLKDNGILFGDNCGNLVKIKNIFNFEIIFKEEDDTKEEIDSLGEFDNGNKYFIIYKIKNSKILKFVEVEIQYN